jgi:transposase
MNVYHLSLSHEEEETLEQMYQHAPKRRLRQRAQMVLLSDKGYCQKEIAQIVGVSYPTARRYLHAYNLYGFCALYDDEKPGRPKRLTQAQEQQIDEWLKDSPRQVGFNQNNWTCRLLRFMIQKVWSIKLSLERVRQIINALGYTLVRPKHQTKKADPFAKKKAEGDLERYKQRAETGEIRLFFVDEIKFILLATLTRMWVKRGTQAHIPMEDNHDSAYAFCGIDWMSLKTHYRIADALNGKNFKAFIAHTRKQYPNDTLVFVLDNAPAHGYTKLRGEVQVDEGLFFYFLPSYSAIDLNPIEKVFKFFRHRVTHNFYFPTLHDLIEAARDFFRYLHGVRSRVASLIGATV